MSQENEDYFLIINHNLYLEAKENGLIRTQKNVIQLYLSSPKKSGNKVKTDKASAKLLTNRPHRPIIGLKRLVGWCRRYLKWTKFAAQFKKNVKTNNIKLIYTVWLGGVWSWPLKKCLGIKLIHSYNDSSLISLSKNIFRIFDSEYWVLKHCDRIDFLSAGIVPRLEKILGKIDQKRILITPNSFILYENYFPEYPKENKVVFLARLTKIKNPILYLQAIVLFNHKYPQLKCDFYVLGSGSENSSIKDYISRNSLDNVFFEGAVYRPWEYLRRSKVFVSLQRDENYPSQSILEAMACENAIVVTDVGETRKLVTENEGVLVDFNPEQIADAFRYLLENEEIRLEMGKKARIKAMAEHNIEKFTEYFYSITS